MFLYSVKTGDSIFTLSKKFYINTKDIIEANSLGPYPYLVVGQTLLIPSTKTSGNQDAVKVKALPHAGSFRTNIVVESVMDIKGQDDTLAQRIYTVNDKCEVKPSGYFTTVSNYNTPKMHLTVNDETLDDVLRNEDNQKLLINNIISVLIGSGYKELYIDGFPRDARLAITFAQNAVKILKPMGISFSFAVEPETWHANCGLAALGNIVDYVVLKEFGLRETPGALLPYSIAVDIVDFAVRSIPSQKVLLALALHGYDWSAPFVRGQSQKQKVSVNQILTIAARQNVKVVHDKASASPFVEYEDEQRIRHIAWFEDAKSLYKKLELASRYNLSGINLTLFEPDLKQACLLIKQVFDENLK